MKRILLVICVSWLSAFLFVACDESEVDFTMNQAELPGTYWQETELYLLGRGHDAENVFDSQSSLDGYRAPMQLTFGEDGNITQYMSVPFTGNNVTEFQVKGSYNYTADAGSLYLTKLYDLACESGRAIVVRRWTAERLEIRVCDHLYGEGTRHVFVRFRPTEEWLKAVSAWPDWDTLPDQE